MEVRGERLERKFAARSRVTRLGVRWRKFNCECVCGRGVGIGVAEIIDVSSAIISPHLVGGSGDGGITCLRIGLETLGLSRMVR